MGDGLEKELGGCTASKSMAEGAEREVILVGRIQCDIVMPVRYCQSKKVFYSSPQQCLNTM